MATYPEKHLYEIQHQEVRGVELIEKRWDDIQEGSITLSVMILERKRVEKRT